MVQNIQKTPTILVTDAHRGSSVSIIRSLGRKGWCVIAAAASTHSPGLYSKYAAEKIIYPSPEDTPHECVQTLLEVARNKAVDLIIPVSANVILPLSAAREQFEGICQLALPEASALEVTVDKLKTIDLAKRLGVPTPRTCLVYTVAEALAQAKEFDWPIVLKPRASQLYYDQTAVESFEVCYAENIEQLTRQMSKFENHCAVLLQEYYKGVGHGVELLTHQGNLLAVFQHKRLRELPIYGGASAMRESVPLDPVMFGYALKLLKELNWTGLAMVEFKVGTEGPKLMEINGRVWGSLPLAVFSGVDFPAYLAELYCNGVAKLQQQTRAPYTVGVRARNLELDLFWILSILGGRRRYPFLPAPSRTQGMKALFEIFNPTYKFDVLSVQDPRPGFVEIYTIMSKSAEKLNAIRQGKL